jgi:hypothetical protein
MPSRGVIVLPEHCNCDPNDRGAGADDNANPQHHVSGLLVRTDRADGAVDI